MMTDTRLFEARDGADHIRTDPTYVAIPPI